MISKRWCAVVEVQCAALESILISIAIQLLMVGFVDIVWRAASVLKESFAFALRVRRSRCCMAQFFEGELLANCRNSFSHSLQLCRRLVGVESLLSVNVRLAST